MGDTKRGSLVLYCLMILSMALAVGCGSEEYQTSPLLDTVPPAIPLDLSAINSPTGGIELDWSANTVDPDLGGYIVYRSSSADRGYHPISQQLVTTNGYTDDQANPGQTYWYTVSARDVNQNESARSANARITATENGSIRVRN